VSRGQQRLDLDQDLSFVAIILLALKRAPHSEESLLTQKDTCMGRFRNKLVAAAALTAWLVGVTPSYAISGTVRVTVAKAGLFVGAGAGRGTLTFRHRNYPFIVQGLSVGITAGASVNKLVGRADYINELSDFAGTYSVVGAGAAVVGGVGGVRLRNAKGVAILLQGPKAGLEMSANITKVVITLDTSRSTPD
jgi:hypothetical protein